MSDQADGPRGLGGWLIVVAIGLLLAPMSLLANLAELLTAFDDGDLFTLMDTNSPAYHPLWGPIFIFETIGNLALVIVVFVSLFMFFNKSRRFPRWYLGLLFGYAAFIMIDLSLLRIVTPEEPLLNPESGRALARTLAVCAVWGPYILISKRVKATFVE